MAPGYKNKLISELLAVCKKYPFDEKILIVTDSISGRQLVEWAVKESGSVFNLRPETISSLALDAAQESIAEKKLKLIGSGDVQAIVDQVFTTLEFPEDRKYFKRNPVNKGIIEALSSTISEMRMQGLDAGSFKPSLIKTPLKGAHLAAILCAFEAYLEKHSLIDAPGVLRLAKAAGASLPDKVIISISNRKYYLAEEEFLASIKGCVREIVNADGAAGLTEASGAGLLSYLFAPSDYKGKERAGIDLFRAAGYENEVREIFRRITAGGIKADEAELVYTDFEAYGGIIYSLGQKLDIPVTFSEGVPPWLLKHGKALLAFLLWARNDFQEVFLRRALELGVINTADWSRKAFQLRESKAGWGRHRYKPILECYKNELLRQAERAKVDGREETSTWLSGSATSAGALLDFCEGLLALVPVPDKDGFIDFGALCAGVLEYIENTLKTPAAVDTDGLVFMAGAKDRIAGLKELMDGKLHYEEALDKLIEIVEGIRVCVSGPLPGHLHASFYRKSCLSGRVNTFLMGFDDSRFPPPVTQDPILLDEEREKLGKAFESSKDKQSRQVRELGSLLAGLNGKACLSWSYYDFNEERKVFPSSLALQAYRLKTGDNGADYDRLEKEAAMAGYNTAEKGRALDETDWWLSKLISPKGEAFKAKASVNKLFLDLGAGSVAEAERQSVILGKYDGLIGVHEELDPGRNEKLILSPSSLESFASCPFKYFMNKVLKVPALDEPERDVTLWLDPAARGTFLHEVYAAFGTQVKGKKLSRKELEKVVDEVFSELVKKWEEKVPPPGPIIKNGEIIRMKNDMAIFVELHASGLLSAESIHAVEFPFTDVKIPLSEGGTLRLRGRIDRVDCAGGNKYIVWDYKTGRGSDFKDVKAIKGGEKLQYCLYAVAAEQQIGGGARVIKSGYLFPTESGSRADDVIRVLEPDFDIMNFAVESISKLIAAGWFPAVSGGEEGPCRFCDYTAACSGKQENKAEILSVNTKTLPPAEDATPEYKIWFNLKRIK